MNEEQIERCALCESVPLSPRLLIHDIPVVTRCSNSDCKFHKLITDLQDWNLIQRAIREKIEGEIPDHK
jgi:hypothetical protein